MKAGPPSRAWIDVEGLRHEAFAKVRQGRGRPHGGHRRLVLVGPVAAAPLEREHYSFEQSDTFTDTECGAPITIDYTGEFSGVFMLKDKKPGGPTPPYLFDNYSGVETFTNVANDETATIKHQGLYKDVQIEHVEGTIYRFTAIETGRPVVVLGPDGKKLVFDAGRIRYTFLVDTLGDAD